MSTESLRVTITITRSGLEGVYDAVAGAEPGRGRSEVLRSILGAYELISSGRLGVSRAMEGSAPVVRKEPAGPSAPGKRGRPKKAVSAPAPASVATSVPPQAAVIAQATQVIPSAIPQPPPPVAVSAPAEADPGVDMTDDDFADLKSMTAGLAD